MKLRGRAARGAWFAAVLGGLFGVAAACSSSPANTAGGGDAGVPGQPEDASGDASTGFTLDALPTGLRDVAAPIDASDDTAPTPVPDAGTCVKELPGDVCGLDPQCGCSAAETCDVSGGAVACVAAGTASLGHGCAATASCAPGLTCFNGACRPYCSRTGDAGCAAKLPEGGACVAVLGADGGPVPGDDLCTFACQLQDPNACGRNGSLIAGCVYDGVSGTDCTDMGLSGIGTACQYINDCLPGLVCAGTCLPWCRIGQSPSDCGDGEACQAFAQGPITANGIEYGYCP